jgi:hypothetical protein
MTRRKKAAGKDTKLPNPLANGRKAPAEEGIDKKKQAKFAKLLILEFFTSEIEGKVTGMMKKSPETVGFAVRLLSDKGSVERGCAVEALADAANKGVDIAIAVPALVGILGSEYENTYERENAARALGGAAENGADMTPAIPALVEALRDWDTLLRSSVANALGIIAGRERKTRTTIVNGILGLMHSEWFQKEMKGNSVDYTEAMEALDRIFDAIKKAEVAQP